jgi:hypothetical protein
MFSEFQEHANIVVLGDPGSGKTHLFRHFAEREVGRFLRVRSFLNLPTVTAAGPLFVDALDEHRSGRGDHATIDVLVQKLFTVSPARVRISCRAQDWLGETDLAALRDYFDVNGGYVVLGLDELTVEERDAIIRSEGLDDAATFAADATNRRLSFLLNNPQNLIMLCRVVKAKGWPATRTDLFERMTELLLTEHNDKKTHAGDGVYCADELKDAAGARRRGAHGSTIWRDVRPTSSRAGTRRCASCSWTTSSSGGAGIRTTTCRATASGTRTRGTWPSSARRGTTST